MSYAEKLKDPRWQRRRLECFQAAHFTCEICFRQDRTLHAHHKHYRPAAEPWEYDLTELACLCERCHAGNHEVLKLVLRAYYMALAVLPGDQVAGVVLEKEAGSRWYTIDEIALGGLGHDAMLVGLIGLARARAVWAREVPARRETLPAMAAQLASRTTKEVPR